LRGPELFCAPGIFMFCIIAAIAASCPVGPVWAVFSSSAVGGGGGVACTVLRMACLAAAAKGDKEAMEKSAQRVSEQESFESAHIALPLTFAAGVSVLTAHRVGLDLQRIDLSTEQCEISQKAR
jgi:hypothetical protein